VIWGKQDPIAVYDIALKLNQSNPSVSLCTLENTGHYPQLEDPEKVAQCLIASWPN
jgi:pimeloyl-ACP methyl ester carboxylesterase